MINSSFWELFEEFYTTSFLMKNYSQRRNSFAWVWNENEGIQVLLGIDYFILIFFFKRDNSVISKYPQKQNEGQSCTA